MDEETIHVVMNQMAEVQARYPGLELNSLSGSLRVCGSVGFCIEHNGRVIEDQYEVELHIPDDFPDSVPTVRQSGTKIPAEFEHFFRDGSFCLGAPVEVRRKFLQHRSLLRFIDEQVIPFLFTYSYLRDFGEPPFGELRHGYDGLVDYYVDHFGTDRIGTLKLLKLLADNFAPPAGPCPCGSGRKLRDCHGPKLDDLRPYYRSEWFEVELVELIKIVQKSMEKSGLRLSERDVMPNRIWAEEQRRRKRAEKRKRR